MKTTMYDQIKSMDIDRIASLLHIIYKCGMVHAVSENFNLCDFSTKSKTKEWLDREFEIKEESDQWEKL